MAPYRLGSDCRTGVRQTGVSASIRFHEKSIGTHTKHAKTGKRGPAPKIQQQLEQIEALPKAKQRVVSQMIDAMLQTNANG